MYRYIFSLLLALLFVSGIYAADLTLTKFTDTKNKISMEFNDTLQLYDFSFTENNLMSPFYESNGNKYYFFYFLNRKFKLDVTQKITNNDNVVNTGKGTIEYKINKCNIVNNPKTILAFMSVIFNDKLEVTCNVLNGKYGLWIAWPSVKEQDKWRKIFDIKDKKLKEEIETKLLRHYKQKKNDTKL